MFLPVLLVRDYGLGGWFVFAIPNVLGAAAFGWVLSRRGDSERLVAENHSACVAFSAITLAFHAFFLAWLAIRVIPVSWCIAAVVAGSALPFVLRHRRILDLILAWLVLAVSVAVLWHGLTHFTISERRGMKNAVDLIWLAPVCIFGFALCPYLDLTFHQAKQATTPAEGKLAFGVGFGVFFLAMIFLTLLYEGDFVWERHYGSFGPIGLRTWVALHLAAQSGFTWMAHLRAQPAWRKRDAQIWIVAAILAGVAALFVWLPHYEWFQQGHFEMLTGEAIYRIFMAFYGLAFPAYVWICLTPIRGYVPGPNRRALIVCAIAIVIAAPMFWAGFIAGQMIWLVPGLAVVLAARLVVPSLFSRRACPVRLSPLDAPGKPGG